MEMVMVPSSGVIIELDDDLTTNCMFVSLVSKNNEFGSARKAG